VNCLAARGLPPSAIAEPVRALDWGKLGNLEILGIIQVPIV